MYANANKKKRKITKITNTQYGSSNFTIFVLCRKYTFSPLMFT